MHAVPKGERFGSRLKWTLASREDEVQSPGAQQTMDFQSFVSQAGVAGIIQELLARWKATCFDTDVGLPAHA